MKTFAFYSRLMWLLAILYAPIVVSGQDWSIPFRFQTKRDSAKGELFLIIQYRKVAGGDGTIVLNREDKPIDFKGAEIFQLEIYVRNVKIKNKAKEDLRIEFGSGPARHKFQPTSIFPLVVELDGFKPNSKNYVMTFNALQNGADTLILPIRVLDKNSGQVLAAFNAKIPLKIIGIPRLPTPEEILCKACGNYSFDTCFLLLKKSPNSPCRSDALGKINNFDERFWAECQDPQNPKKRNNECLTRYLDYFKNKQYTGKYDSLARAWLKEKPQPPPPATTTSATKKTTTTTTITPPKEPLSLILGQKQPDGSWPLKINHATSPRYKDISWDEGLEVSWSADSSMLQVRYPPGGGIYGILVQDPDGRRDSMMFEDDAMLIRLETDASRQQYSLQISHGQSPYRIDFVDGRGVVFSVKRNDNTPYEFSIGDLIAAGLVGLVTIKARDADDLTDRVVPTKINLPPPTDSSFWLLLGGAIGLVLFLVLLLYWRRRKIKKQMMEQPYP